MASRLKRSSGSSSGACCSPPVPGDVAARRQPRQLLQPQIPRIDPLAVAQHHRRFDDMGQLAHIPWPIILLQSVQRLTGEASWLQRVGGGMTL